MEYDAVEARIAEQATTVRRLKWTIVFLVLSTVINTATFGGLAHSMVGSDRSKAILRWWLLLFYVLVLNFCAVSTLCTFSCI